MVTPSAGRPTQPTHQGPLRVVVAGVPRSYQQPQEDGRWLTPEHIATLQAVSPLVELFHTTRAELTRGEAPPPADVLLLEASGAEPYRDEIPAEGVAALVTPRLRWVQSCSSGIGHILALNILGPDVLLTNAAGVHADALAESVMAGILLHAKRLPERLALQRQRDWRELHCSELCDKTVLVVGTGHIGQAVARLAAAFRMHVIGVRRSDAATPFVAEQLAPGQLKAGLARADYIVIACPLTPETIGLLGPAEFAATKRGAYLLNVSRGRVVQEAALLRALHDGTLSGAYLDAHIQEPLPPEHPLWTIENAVVIPHDSHSSPYIGDNIVALFADNLRRFIAGKPLRNLVDRNRGY
ncbi:MAG: D-2-hydroxyacid dehydrogenase [Chloroflexi bacterium]|nr:MAG: D-2-hydroxyacid dehydrogenase [Chloroflexota bacterium]